MGENRYEPFKDKKKGSTWVRRGTQGRHGEFEPDKAQYSTPNFFDQLFLIRAY